MRVSSGSRITGPLRPGPGKPGNRRRPACVPRTGNPGCADRDVEAIQGRMAGLSCRGLSSSVSPQRVALIDSCDLDGLLAREDVSVLGEKLLSTLVGEECVEGFAMRKGQKLNLQGQRFVLIDSSPTTEEKVRAMRLQKPQNLILESNGLVGRRSGRVSNKCERKRLTSWRHGPSLAG